MRRSSLPKDTSKLVSQIAGSAALPSRRSTRSLSRLVQAAPGTAAKSPAKSPAKRAATTPDIEDAIGPPPAKRRRHTAVKAESVVKSENVVVESETVVKTEMLDEQSLTSAVPSPPSKTRGRARKPPRRKSGNTADSDLDASVAAAVPPGKPPPNWEAMYKAVERMRAPGGPAYGAPVDTMGCERLSERQASPKERRYHTLVALMLSSQTKDTTNAVVMLKLKTELPAYKPGAPVGLNLDNMLAVEPALLNQLIWAVGFHNNKTRYLKEAAVILRDKWGGDIPDSIEGLMSLPGVGPKMAYLCMTAAWDVTLGIGVDVHVHRITNLWRWHKTKTPEETRLALESWLPRDKWRPINGLLVGFGQEVCRPVGRRCGDCDLGVQGLCRARDRKKVADGPTLLQQQPVVKVESVAIVDGDKVDEVVLAKVDEAVKEEVELGG